MLGYTKEQAQAERFELQKRFNPNNPEHVRMMRELVAAGSGGKYTIGTEKDLIGKGLYAGGSPLTGEGRPAFTVMESEMEREKRNPNSAAYRERLANLAAKQKQDEWNYRKYGTNTPELDRQMKTPTWMGGRMK
jgi:hypothetical protein